MILAHQNDHQNLSFVKDINVLGQKMTRNGCKLAKRKSCQFFKSPVFNTHFQFQCVPNPNHMEIRDVLMSAGYQPIVENKQYPRERSREFEFRGRIRVQLKNDDGSPHLEKFQTRESIMEHLGNFFGKIVD